MENTKMKIIEEWKEKYESKGMVVIPMGTHDKDGMGKAPIPKNWNNMNEKEFEFPPQTVNIGIATGTRSGIWVLDIDVKDKGLEIFKKLQKDYGAIPPTAKARTGSGGYHYLFRYDPSKYTIKSKTKKEMIKDGKKTLTGIDCLCEGKIFVVEPSINQVTKGEYKWETPYDTIIEAPTWILQLVDYNSYIEYNSKTNKIDIKYDYKNKIPTPYINPTDHIKLDEIILQIALLCLKPERYIKYRSEKGEGEIYWRELCMIFVNSGYSKKEWIKYVYPYSKKHYHSPSKTEHEELYDKFAEKKNEKGLSVGTLIITAKKDNPKKWKYLIKEYQHDQEVLIWNTYFIEDIEEIDKCEPREPPSYKKENWDVYYTEDDINEIDNYHKEVPTLPKEEKIEFTTYTSLVKHDLSVEEIYEKYIKHCIVFIVNGGNAYYMTKNIKNGVESYEIITGKGCLQQIVFGHNPKNNLWNILTKVRNEITYSYVDFIPKDVVDHKVFNLYDGMIAAKNKKYGENKEKLQILLNHIREVLCDNNEESYEYMLKWLAHLIQKPYEKLPVAVLIKSIEGAGKSSYFKFIGDHILGAKYYIACGFDRIMNKFNSASAEKLLTVISESQDGEGAKHHERLKEFISEDDLIVEKKGIDAYKTKNYSRTVILTNNDYPVKLTAGDRRFFCLEANGKYKQDFEYMKKFLSSMDEEGGVCLYRYLKTIDIKNWNFMKLPGTEYRLELKFNSLIPPIKFMIDFVIGEISIDWNNEVKMHTEKLYEIYEDWRKKCNITYPITLQGFSKKINELQKSKDIKINGKSKKGYVFVRNELLNSLRTYLNEPTWNPVLYDTKNNEDEDNIDILDTK